MLVIKGQSSAEKSVQNNSAGPPNKILKNIILKIKIDEIEKQETYDLT
jgi:hypothetical protein